MNSVWTHEIISNDKKEIDKEKHCSFRHVIIEECLDSENEINLRTKIHGVSWNT